MHQTVSSSRRARVAAALFVALLATSVYAVSVSGVAGAAANKTVAGNGTGDVTCPNEATEYDVVIQLQAYKFKGGVEGYGYIGNGGGGVHKEFYITAGTINMNSYTLQAIVTYDACGGGYPPVPVNATISGKCGTDTVINYTDANGETGSFEGSVACT